MESFYSPSSVRNLQGDITGAIKTAPVISPAPKVRPCELAVKFIPCPDRCFSFIFKVNGVSDETI